MAFSTTSLVFEPNALYIAILDRGETYSFQWELYLAKTATEGIVFHITNEAGQAKWEYDRAQTNQMPQQRRLLLALNIGSVEPVLHNALSDRLALVPLTPFSSRFSEQLNCRVWLKEALFVIDDEGYVNLGKGPAMIEEEARYLAMMCKSKHERKVVRSKMCMS
ncbi:uncharacterized protein N7484_003808 [Penicillium longicatenatum]|uniref:uncharacterized protein n=1 Tax=Penicillium longicatenatum TaxID=1561947 RepID=UPI002548B770|nr:uncharacterized protein N7484_003808 [Penicillium longicatenatum]KAJ5650085.1 hypothetical protein N7484_003808 [Penicillium longicatenatum]